MRALLLLSLVAALVATGCREGDKATPVPADKTPAPTATTAVATTDTEPLALAADAAPPPAPPASVVVPPGAIRFRATTAGDAARLIADAFNVNVLARDGTRTASFATDARSARGALAAAAAALELDVEQRKGLHVLAPVGQLRGPWTRAPRGVNVDLSFAMASGQDLASLLANVGTLTLDGDPGATFSMRIKRVDSNLIAVALGRACGAEVSIDKKRLRFAGSGCAPIPPTATTGGEDDEARDTSGWRSRVILGKTVVRSDKSLRLVGVATPGRRPVALVGASGSEPPDLVKKGDLVGALDDTCARWASRRPRTTTDWEEARRDLSAASSTLKDARRGNLSREQLRAEASKLKSSHERDAARLAGAIKRDAAHGKRRPAWCAPVEGRVGERLWKVSAIDSDGIELRPILVEAGDNGAFAPTILTEWPDELPRGLAPIRLPISD